LRPTGRKPELLKNDKDPEMTKNQANNLIAEAHNLIAEALSLWADGDRLIAKGYRLRANGNRLNIREGD